MPAPATVDELLELIRKSGVVEDGRLVTYIQKLKSLMSAVPREPNKLAGLMVRDGLLTYFQAEQVLQGKWKRFTIGKYKVLEKLGSGGMGQVFLCEHKLMRRRVAVKVLPTAKAEDQSSLERFYREARAAAALDHQNIVRAYDIDQDDNLHFLVMEFVDGSSFQDIVKKSGPMDVLRACHYIYWSAIGMQHAHEQGIIHRDIKPGNILVDRMGVVKILDMGLARFFNDDEDLITKKFDENVLGTADYLAPEQALDSHTVDGRADIYSLGATFYFLLTAGPPFVEGTVAQKLIWHQNREPKSLKAQRADIPDGVVKIISKMMAKDPNNRFQTPAELAATLGPWIQTPIAPPPESEMPLLCPAVLAAGTGMVSTTNLGKNTPSVSGSGMMPALRRSSGSSMQLAPIPTPPMGAGQHPSQMLAEVMPGNGNRQEPPADGRRDSGGETDPAPGEQVWATFADTNEITPGNTDRKPGSSRKKNAPAPRPRTGPGKTGPWLDFSKPKLWIWIGIGILILVGAIGIIKLLAGGSSSNSGKTGGNQPEGPRKILVSKQTPVDVAKLKVDSIQRAFEIAQAKDIIIIQDEEWSETVNVEKAKKDLLLCPAEGKRVNWKLGDTKNMPLAVFSVGYAENMTVRGIDFNAGNATAAVVRISGTCPGLTLEDVGLADGRDFGLKFIDCVGDASRQVKLVRVRVTSTNGTSVGIGFQGTASRQAASTNQQTAFVRVENCRLEGNFKTAAFQFEGQVTDVEVTQNRIWDSVGGVYIVKRTNPDQEMRFGLSYNTFHTLTGSLLRFEAVEPLTGPTAAGKYKFEFIGNYLFNANGPLATADDGKAVPKPTDGKAASKSPLIVTNNVRNGPPDSSFPTTEIDVQLSTDWKDDRVFLRSDALKSAGPMKTSVGATIP